MGGPGRPRHHRAFRFLSSLFVLLASSGSSLGFAASLTRGPYLQLLGETTVTVVWNTDDATECGVEIRPLAGLMPTIVPGETTQECVVTIDGLSPGTKYGYRPLAGGEPLDTETVFRTDDRNLPFTFLVVGDGGTGDEVQRRLAERMTESPADLVVHTGDMIYEAAEPSLWTPNFFEPYRDLVRRLVFWPCLGNHDVKGDDGESWREVFITPANNALGTENYYSFDYGNAHFVVLDSNTSLRPGKPQHTWLVEDLAASMATWNFVFFHHSIYSSGGRHGSNSVLGERMIPVLDAFGVDLVFMGHEHDYERTLPLFEEQVVEPGEGTVYVTTGGGGRELHPNGESHFTAYSESSHHFVRILVDRGTLLLEMERDDGAIGDSMTLVKGERPRCGDGRRDILFEQCDGGDDGECPGSCDENCLCPPVCGDDVAHPDAEECDGADDSLCPGLCRPDCRCAAAPIAVEARVVASTDDAEERENGDMTLTSRDLDLVYAQGDQTVGIRFAEVPIPRDAEIVRADVQFVVDETTSGATSVSLRGEATGHALPFSKTPRDVSSRPVTDATVQWVPSAWTSIHASGLDQRTPNLASVVQEIVDRPDWVSGNAMALIVTGSGKRVAYSYDGDPARAPLLYAEYFVPTSTTTTSTLPPSTTTTTVPPPTTTTAPPAPSTTLPTTTTTTTVLVSTTTTTTVAPPPETLETLSGRVLADVSVRQLQSSINFGSSAELWVDGDLPKHAFVKAVVEGVGARVVREAKLSLRVADAVTAESVSGGRVRILADCGWDESLMTWDNRPVIDGEVLDEVGAVARGERVEFDVSAAIPGDGIFCFALDSESPDGVTYESKDGWSSGPALTVVVSSCGNNVVDATGEECDGDDDAPCPGQCRDDCACPPPPPTTTTASSSTTTSTTSTSTSTTTTTTTSTTTTTVPLVRGAFVGAVATSADDAEERGSGRVRLDSSDLDLVFDKSDQTVGLRFTATRIPRGATILDAYVQFRADNEVESGATDLVLHAEASDDAPVFSTETGNVSSRPRTDAWVPWSPPPWSEFGAAGVDQRTPSLVALVQEVVDRPGWSSGNALVLIITGSGLRVAESYDGDPTGAPVLHVDFEHRAY